MKNRINGKQIALAGIGASLSLGAVVASFYFSQLSISLNVLASFGIMLPLVRGYYREGILAYVVVCILGALFANIHILPFVLVGGLYTILTVALYNKTIKLNVLVSYLLKFIYSCIVFFILYYLAKILYLDIDALGIELGPIPLYFVLNLLFSIIFMLYDALIIYSYRLIVHLEGRIAKK